ncbi:LysR family transcriptional regulator [Rhizorhabdus dicambivorans]|uniref:LysR family transcriptional regulator n=1 Tax=Rhizorhabdus dicambivorans TaxID=1850238 RepID=A0A2A4G040_9SPHN|nr:LysR family transcriptional regulator [Rhizorhabdus dicambivorans]ATE63180.1 LysR family transcriptional regulator [Rhizorhabdus dicambivorans]PCE43357.1 LysR family transcriptional regulator [Rhizorhabdus dicambivorans]
MARLPDFEAWAVFAKVAELGSFSGAAAELRLSKATVSKAVSRLEERLGTPLFHRSSRKLSLTESGSAAQERASFLLAEGEAIEEAISERGAVPRGLVRLAAPMSFGIAHLRPILPLFLQAYPEVAIDLHLSDERIDLIEQGFDIALRIGQLEDSALKARRLFPVRLPLVGAPALFDRLGRPEHPRDIPRYPAIIYTHVRAPGRWYFSHRSEGDLTVEVKGPIRTNNGDVILDALLAGTAIAPLPDFLAWKCLAAGSLEEVLADWSIGRTAALHVVTPPTPLRPARVKVLIDFLAAAFLKPPWTTS